MKYVYKIKRVSKCKFSLDCSNSYVINPKITGINVLCINLYDDFIINSYVRMNCLKKIKKILELYLQDEESDGTFFVNQLDALEFMIVNNLKIYLRESDTSLILKNIYNLRSKIIFKNNNFTKVR